MNGRLEQWYAYLKDMDVWRRPWSTASVTVTGPDTEYYYDGWSQNPNIRCHNCLVLYDRGMAGDDATTVEEARVSAHANGWYVTGSAIICPPCRRKIAEGIKEDE